MRLKTPKFMRRLTNKYASKMLSKELGFEVHIQLDELYLDTKDGKYKIRIEAEVEGDKKGIKKLIKSSLKK